MNRFSLIQDELWKDIKEYEGLYQVSNLGRIKSLKNNFGYEREKILRLNKRNTYFIVQLTKNKIRKSKQVHRLVAEAFLDNYDNSKVINHKDFNRLNNSVSNLECITQKENVIYSIENMQKRKNITHSNTGEKYITKRKNKYRVTIDKKEYKNCNSLEDAIKKRDEILNEKI